jgi:hypothetical protein
MTDKEINKRIAEFCGFTNISDGGMFGYRQDLCGNDGRCSLPIYTNDLNAMHEAEMMLPIEGVNNRGWDGSRSEFRWVLGMVCPQPIHAKARQRAEALLKTIGQWEEGK